jgi:hypothetical protein
MKNFKILYTGFMHAKNTCKQYTVIDLLNIALPILSKY